MNFNVNGKHYSSMQEWAEEQKHDPNSTSIIWEYQEANMIVNGRPQKADGSYGKGKCWYKGKCYEGEIDYREDGIYVGGELVKPNENNNLKTETETETMEAKNYDTLTLHGQGYTINANVINKIEIHGQGHTVRTGKCGNVEVHGMGNNVYRNGDEKPMSLHDCFDHYEWDDIIEELKSKNVYILDEDDSLACNIPDVLLKEELERRGWNVKCTRTTTEEL